MILSGLASTPDLDLHRTRLRAYCLGYPLPKYCKHVPLLLKHRADEPAGEIESLEYDDRGGLLIRARVDDPTARRCGAFSVAVTVRDYAIRDPDDRDGFHAAILSARLDEVSLTDVKTELRDPRPRFGHHQRGVARLQQRQTGAGAAGHAQTGQGAVARSRRMGQSSGQIAARNAGAAEVSGHTSRVRIDAPEVSGGGCAGGASPHQGARTRREIEEARGLARGMVMASFIHSVALGMDPFADRQPRAGIFPQPLSSAASEACSAASA